MTVLATDDFNRASIGANWTTIVFGNSLTISSNEAAGSVTGQDHAMTYNAITTPDDQYAQMVLAATGVGEFTGPLVRGDANDYVFLDALGGDSWDIEWYNSGAWTVIGSSYGTSPANNDVGKIEAEGTTFRGYINGGTPSPQISGSNASAPSTGDAGLYIYNTNGRADDFEVGNLVNAIIINCSAGTITLTGQQATIIAASPEININAAKPIVVRQPIPAGIFDI